MGPGPDCLISQGRFEKPVRPCEDLLILQRISAEAEAELQYRTRKIFKGKLLQL